MPFPPLLGADQDSGNSAFVATFQAYLAADAPEGDLPTACSILAGFVGDAEFPSIGTAGQNLAGDPLPGRVASFAASIGVDFLSVATLSADAETFSFRGSWGLGGFLGYAGNVVVADSVLPPPPIPAQGAIGEPTIGPIGKAFPPTLGTDTGNLPFGKLFSASEYFNEPGYFLGSIQGFIGTADTVPVAPTSTLVLYENPSPSFIAGAVLPISTFQAFLVASPEAMQSPLPAGGALLADTIAGPLSQNLQNDPANPLAQLDGQFDVFVGQVQPPFTTTRLPRLAFGPFINLSGLTFQIELDAFAKFGLAQIQYRIYANDQATPPYNVINLGGQASFTASPILTLDSAAATLHADAVVADSFGNIASLSALLPGVPDFTPPTAPPFLYVLELPDTTWLFVWGQATDDFVVDYYQIDQVDPVGDLITNLASGIKPNYYIWGGAAAGNSYRVLTYDLAGNVSPSSPITKAVATVFPDIEITEVIAEQLPGTDTILVAWAVTPPGTPCTAVIVDALEHVVGDPVVSTTGQATLTVPMTVQAGLFRVKVAASA